MPSDSMAVSAGMDYLSLSAEDFAALDDWQTQQAMQLIVGHMAVAEATVRRYAEAHYAYMAAKEEFSRLRQLGSILQTIARTKA